MSTLSEKLDAARRARDEGQAPDLVEGGYQLRMRIERPRYDGTDLRTGDSLTTEDWDRIRAQREGGVPRLGADRPETSTSSDDTVIDLRQRLEAVEDEEPAIDLTTATHASTGLDATRADAS